MGNTRRLPAPVRVCMTCATALLAILAASATAVSCASAVERLRPPRSTLELRLDDIEASIESEPELAIHRLGAFAALYPAGRSEDGAKLASLGELALHSLEAAAGKAIDEKAWPLAASRIRSLHALGKGEGMPSEAELLLFEARDRLSAGEDLEAFVAASASDALSPLVASDALSFFARAAALGQRGNAAFFLAAAERAGASADADSRAWALGQDSAADMIRRVATVWVDRGIRIEKGLGLPDRVIGSAFFVDKRGLLVTNYHVIASEVDPEYEGYSRLYVRLGDDASARIPAKVVGWDRALDLAVLKVELVGEYVFSLLGGANPLVGDRVFAIGSPAGLEKTVTAGIVSAAGRRFLQLGDALQIDAAVNHGNSGGPVVDEKGRTVGVVFAGIEQFEGINFAVPARRLAAALPAMTRGGKAERPWLGLTVDEGRNGVQIIYVAPGTPAADQLFTEGLFLKSVGGVLLDAKSLIPEAQDILFPRRPGELVAVELSDGKRLVLAVAASVALGNGRQGRQPRAYGGPAFRPYPIARLRERPGAVLFREEGAPRFGRRRSRPFRKRSRGDQGLFHGRGERHRPAGPFREETQDGVLGDDDAASRAPGFARHPVVNTRNGYSVARTAPTAILVLEALWQYQPFL